MKVTVKSETLNPNSIEKRDLYLRNKYIGQYDYGVYSKIVLLKARKHELLPNYENFICGILHKYFNVDILNKKDVENVMKLCKEKEHIDLIDLVNNMLQEESKKYYEN